MQFFLSFEKNNNMKNLYGNKTIFKKKDTRTRIILIFTIVTFFMITIRLIYLNIFMGSYYNMMLDKSTNQIVYGESAPRGRILDRNGKVLVDNKAVKSIYYKKSFL